MACVSLLQIELVVTALLCVSMCLNNALFVHLFRNEKLQNIYPYYRPHASLTTISDNIIRQFTGIWKAWLATRNDTCPDYR